MKVIRSVCILLALFCFCLNSRANENIFSNDWPEDYVGTFKIKELESFKEESLWEKRSLGYIYRFIAFSQWGNPTLIKFVMNPDGNAVLVVKQTDGLGEYKEGKLIVDETVALNNRETQEIINQFEKINFWNLPTFEGFDESSVKFQWIIEGVKDGHFHLINRLSSSSGDIYETCIMLFNMAGFDLNAEHEAIFRERNSPQKGTEPFVRGVNPDKEQYRFFRTQLTGPAAAAA